jgi:serine/threonine-protein kinase
VKPQNVLRGRDGSVKLGDFGIARSREATALTQAGSVLGTAAYLAPEQARGEPAGAAADLYALGVVLYQSLTGRVPYEAASLPELVLLREREPPLPPGALAPDVPAGLDATVLACLALDPAARPASAAALSRDLTAALDPAETVRLAAVPPRRRRRRWPLAAAIALLAALGAALALALRPGGGQAPATSAAAPPPTTVATHAVTTAAPPAVPVTTPAPRPEPRPEPPPPDPCRHGPKPGHGHDHGPKKDKPPHGHDQGDQRDCG